MSFSGLLVQLLNGLADASSLFLVAAGLTLIFGVTRVVNFAHGSFFMLGLYVAYSLAQYVGGAWGFWLALPLAALAMGLLGWLVERLVLRRIYHAPELFQLLATFALVLIFQDFCLWLWGPEDLLGPRAPGLGGALQWGERSLPSYDLFLVVLAPLVLAGLWWLLRRTRWGVLVRAATADRAMTSALGVDPARLFTSVFVLGSALAGLGGALQLPRQPASLSLDLGTVTDAFVVVVMGGMGSLPGAYAAAVLLAELKALCIGLGTVEIGGVSWAFSKLTLVVEFAAMAVVLIWRPWGISGRALAVVAETPRAPLAPSAQSGVARHGPWVVAALTLLLAFSGQWPYAVVLGTDMLVAALFAASLHFLMGTGGLNSFGHAAYLGLGSYAAAGLMLGLGWPMPLALLGAPFCAALVAVPLGWFSVRLSGIYLAMLTLANAQILWAVVYQWDGLTGGSNGLSGLWPVEWLADRSRYFALSLLLSALGVLALRRVRAAPLGWALRAVRDSRTRALAVGLNPTGVQWLAMVLAAGVAGLAGALAAFSKGSIAPDGMSVARSVDGLIMVLLGGVDSANGPLWGAAALTWLQDTVARNTEYWRALLGALILALVLLFPSGLAGAPAAVATWLRARQRGKAA